MQQSKVYIEILKELNEIIINDQLQNGDKLPSERELSERLQVGRSSVREALRALELLDLIETKRGEGTFIKKAGSYRLVEIVLSFVLRDEVARADLAETRRIIEVEAMKLACQRITTDTLTELKQLLGEAKEEASLGQVPLEKDYLFHKKIVEASQNKLLINIWLPLVEYHKAATEQKDIKDFTNEHEDIYQALVEKNEQKAVQVLTRHLENSWF
ncbi:FadR/GntR family transcriptional regulator [Bacillus alkalicellulosilyticus]|uniref:FadR/GntR family transcriptional regulator n=1 Tax=Alkalihalobacterium alkalicellulosilyticum TaxID=1912214 RepID=UPI0009984C2B|nr:FadR/GntR family transcriptional regulator [Bacillus alkalicellulosilyticus]